MTVVRTLKIALTLAATFGAATLFATPDAAACGPYEPPTQESLARSAAVDRVLELVPTAKIGSVSTTVDGDAATVILELAGKTKPFILRADLAKKEAGWKVISFRQIKPAKKTV